MTGGEYPNYPRAMNTESITNRWPRAMAAAACAMVLLGGCASSPGRKSDGAAAADGPIAARLFKGLGSHRRAVTTTSREAQKYFDPGLTWAYAFNHDEAARSFARAGELADVKGRLKRVWGRSDVEMGSSSACVKGKG